MTSSCSSLCSVWSYLIDIVREFAQPAKDPYAWVGYIATVCSTVCYIPQIRRIRQTRSAKDISYAMFLIWIVGSTLWLTYGIRTHKMPVILTNLINLCFRVWVLSYKIIADRRKVKH
jgi:MtN3 and saliva related transmembrane protein